MREHRHTRGRLRPELASVAGEFGQSGTVELPALLAASAQFAAAVRAGGADVVATPITAPAVVHLMIRSAAVIGHCRQAQTRGSRDMSEGLLVQSVLITKPQAALNTLRTGQHLTTTEPWRLRTGSWPGH